MAIGGAWTQWMHFTYPCGLALCGKLLRRFLNAQWSNVHVLESAPCDTFCNAIHIEETAAKSLAYQRSMKITFVIALPHTTQIFAIATITHAHTHNKDVPMHKQWAYISKNGKHPCGIISFGHIKYNVYLVEAFELIHRPNTLHRNFISSLQFDLSIRHTHRVHFTHKRKSAVWPQKCLVWQTAKDTLSQRNETFEVQKSNVYSLN